MIFNTSYYVTCPQRTSHECVHLQALPLRLYQISNDLYFYIGMELFTTELCCETKRIIVFNIYNKL